MTIHIFSLDPSVNMKKEKLHDTDEQNIEVVMVLSSQNNSTREINEIHKQHCQHWRHLFFL